MQTSIRNTESVRRQFSDASRYLRGNFEIASRADILRSLLPCVEALTIVDVGCGDGSLSLQFLKEAKHLTLVDLSADMLRRAEARIPAGASCKVTLVNTDLMHFQPAEAADVVICVGVLAHVEDLAPVVQKLAAMTKAGGRCVMQMTDRDRVFGKVQSAFSRSSYPLLNISKVELLRITSSAGFKLCREVSHYLLLPGMGRLPARWLLAWDKYVLTSPLLSRLAPSAVLLFER